MCMFIVWVTYSGAADLELSATGALLYAHVPSILTVNITIKTFQF